MNLDLEQIVRALNSLYGMPKVGLVFISCIVFGWVIKQVKVVHNSAIPGYVVMWGAVWLPVLSDWPESSIKTVTRFILLNITIGFIVGAAATASHRWVVKPLLKKFGVTGEDTEFRAREDFPDSKPKPPVDPAQPKTP